MAVNKSTDRRGIVTKREPLVLFAEGFKGHSLETRNSDTDRKGIGTVIANFHIYTVCAVQLL